MDASTAFSYSSADSPSSAGVENCSRSDALLPIHRPRAGGGPSSGGELPLRAGHRNWQTVLSSLGGGLSHLADLRKAGHHSESTDFSTITKGGDASLNALTLQRFLRKLPNRMWTQIWMTFYARNAIRLPRSCVTMAIRATSALLFFLQASSFAFPYRRGLSHPAEQHASLSKDQAADVAAMVSCVTSNGLVILRFAPFIFRASGDCLVFLTDSTSPHPVVPSNTPPSAALAATH
jgi:hypothetical protein